MPIRIYGMELSNITREYRWERSGRCGDLVTLCPGTPAEEVSFQTVFCQTRRQLAQLGVQVCFLPSYWPVQSLAALAAAKSLRLPTVMMNESHQGTARAHGLARWVKQQAVRLFDVALVGGQPHKRHFAALGIPPQKIFTGYDAVDNDYFARQARNVRGQAESLRSLYDLPSHYFLSLGRFITKKNLETLVRAFRGMLARNPRAHTHLVFVGSGVEEANLRELCRRLNLQIFDKSQLHLASGNPANLSSSKNPLNGSPNVNPAVHFYGFRQLTENPVFYALADAFVLPSLYEEWGLVVNEALASRLPVIVSETAGCAEDLLETGNIVESLTAAAFQQVQAFGLVAKLRRNGCVFNPCSASELSRILLLFESQPELRSIMGQASEQIVERFSCANFAENALRAAHVAAQRSVFSPLRATEAAWARPAGSP
jgi:glycosyltransferase involved in cell wall biosynthesis